MLSMHSKQFGSKTSRVCPAEASFHYFAEVTVERGQARHYHDRVLLSLAILYAENPPLL